MAYAATTATAHFGLVDRIRVFFNDYKEASARQSQYRKTVAELSALTNHELADIGIGRGQIQDIAREHAYGA